jgi:hypothetical protein
MRVYYEWGIRQFRKQGEELCGDSVVVTRHPDSVTLALSDGLGSGVKANILATLTTRIAMHLLENGLPLDDVVETLGETLPICQVRKLAYSTFSIAQFFREGQGRVVEFDSPSVILLRERKRQPLLVEERQVNGKAIREIVFDMRLGDWVAFVSDGVVNAGIGGVYPLGWGLDQAAKFLAEQAHPGQSAQQLADVVAEAADDLYGGHPGDDVSVVVIKVRRKRVANVLTGPPETPEKTDDVISRFLNHTGLLAVCGGTTGKLVAKHIGSPLQVDLGTATPDVPPVGRVAGLDLVTEGILTLTQVREMLRSKTGLEEVKFRNDGAAALIRLFLESDEVRFTVGQAVNPAHQNPDLPHQLGIRLSVVREIVGELKKRHIETRIDVV